MVKSVLKNKKTYDFFTEIVIIFPINSTEHKIKLAVHGDFQKQGDKTFLIPIKYNIIEIKNRDKLIQSSSKIIKFVNNWIKNNENKFISFVSTELVSMMGNSAKNNKSRLLIKNPIDKQ